MTKMGLWPISCGINEGSFRNELEMVPLEWRRQQEPPSDIESELNNYRIGSDPPTIDGSLSAVDGVLGNPNAFTEFASNNNNHHTAMSEQELRSDPGDLSYYHSDISLNRRSVQGWHGTNSVLGGIGDNRRVSEVENGSGRWFSSNKEVSEAEPEKVQGSVDWVKDGLPGLQGFRLADLRNDLAGTFQVLTWCCLCCV